MATTQLLKMEIVGHTEDPEVVAATGGKHRNAPSQPPFTSNEKVRLVHCVACPEFRSCVELMLRGVTNRVAIDDKMNRVLPFKELVIIFINPDMQFKNFFLDHEHGDEDLRGIDPNDSNQRPESFLKGDELFPFHH
jgi:hypothetical protein